MIPQPPPDPFLLFGFVKVPVLVVSLIAAVLSVLLDVKRHSWGTAIMAIISGIVVAILCTEPVVGFLNARGAEHAIAGVLGIAGRNLIIWVSIISKDPMALLDAIRGKK